ncbi:hypothetical protein DRJ53_05280 [Paracnuella aquatica]|nr:hypothetical protein DRJ53_05280 [Paracnuella aquatica]
MTEGEEYYINSQGLLVFTEKYHRARGYCCGRGCLHCPFNYSAVREPRRSELLQQRAEREAGDKKEE